MVELWLKVMQILDPGPKHQTISSCIVNL